MDLRKTRAPRSAVPFRAVFSFGVLLAVLGTPMWVSAQADTVLFIGTNRNNEIIETRAQPGEVARVGLHYSDPSSNIQGFTITICHDPILTAIPDSFELGSVFEVIGAEFVTVQIDDDVNDGDGKELIIGILLDAIPPFENQTAPPTLNPIEIGTIQFQVPATVDCFTCLPILFCDNINGTENLLLSNRVVIDNESVQPSALPEGEICVPRHALFVRGDVNNDGMIDVADVVASLNYLFLNGTVPVCLDAADTDNDGLETITDPVFLALYIFNDGIAPPSPFPDCGIEPTPDDDGLDCFEPTTLCPVCP